MLQLTQYLEMPFRCSAGRVAIGRKNVRDPLQLCSTSVSLTGVDDADVWREQPIVTMVYVTHDRRYHG